MLRTLSSVNYRLQAVRTFTQTSFFNSRYGDLVNHIQATVPIHEITPSDLRATLQATSMWPVVIDVRESSEHAEGKIPHAVCLSRGLLERDVEKVVSVESERPIVVYCAGGMRSILAAEGLIRLGYAKERILSLRDGFDGWKKEGFEIEMPKEERK
ncbi:rhodanese domain protein [Jimgerdemannia flammicorona]|uniref:Rhodanese domain protein n=2 Tax=Jimgerdemannia flammicorona TaxID=994334 RepID=A0A433QQH8_9FUNG|nr:rhodanese domain protein [Jimgerdemannia flammicorona]RUS32053.1 rhodanese domain protein [Jimgerdemannia flammicorona]